MKFLSSAGIVLFRNKNTQREYLLLHYLGGHWDFAKGKLEEGETKEQAALRELQEETSLSAQLLPGFLESLSYIFKEQGGLVKKTVYFFVGKAQKGDVRLSHEHQGFVWLAYKQAYEKLTYQNAREILDKAESFLNA